MSLKNLTASGLAIEVELRSEQASTLGRAGRELERQLVALERAEASLAAAPPSERPRAARLAGDARREAERRLWYLIVQREAMGLFRHDEVYELYAVPRSLVPSP